MNLSSGSSGSSGYSGLGGTVEKGRFFAFDIDFNGTLLIIFFNCRFRFDDYKLSLIFFMSS